MDVKARILEIIVPTEIEVEIKDGERVEVEKKMYAGYLLVNMFLDDDLWFAIYLQSIKKSKIENLIEKFRTISTDSDVPTDSKGRKIIYSQHSNSLIDSLHLNEHKKRFLIYNRRKIQKIEYIKFIIKSLFSKL